MLVNYHRVYYDIISVWQQISFINSMSLYTEKPIELKKIWTQMIFWACHLQCMVTYNTLYVANVIFGTLNTFVNSKTIKKLKKKNPTKLSMFCKGLLFNVLQKISIFFFSVNTAVQTYLLTLLPTYSSLHNLTDKWNLSISFRVRSLQNIQSYTVSHDKNATVHKLDNCYCMS